MASFTERLLTRLEHVPTEGQHKAIDALSRLLATEKQHATLVLKGYAGTGKTTLVGALVKVLAEAHKPVVLLAPTGRAAKVLSAYAGASASTIHRRIYRTASDEDGGYGGMSVAANKEQHALFVVDEASMIGKGGGGAFDRDLLADLFQYVFSSAGNKLLLIGDPAQLPPVGSDHSPALEVKDLAEQGLLAGSIELTDVVRQAEASGILVNATALRGTLASMPVAEQAGIGEVPVPTGEKIIPQFITGFPDVVRVEGYDLQDALEEAYARHGDEEVCLICRSNKRAYQYSQQVRARIHGFEEELEANDRLMVVKNNYFWAARETGAGPGSFGLIANGEQVTVQRVHGTEERYGLRFADLTIGWWDGREDRELEVKVILDGLASEGPALPGARMRQLSQDVLAGIIARTKGERFRLFKQDPYANALQVKYAYAVTCHKAQGGQWKSVFVDQGYVTEEMIDREYVRWLYTAVTRASEKLYLLNFHPRFFGEGEE
ncbi:MAG: AAA family ATPase [Flavobacteriales bacterium]|jgi:exodeoxyribonuclease-5|nr:AAA family ATPase [Flavobacteriales bacterium]MCB0758752.1 AAA family ATPase [Flavobacteriales bacterium]